MYYNVGDQFICTARLPGLEGLPEFDNLLGPTWTVKTVNLPYEEVWFDSEPGVSWYTKFDRMIPVVSTKWEDLLCIK